MSFSHTFFFIKTINLFFPWFDCIIVKYVFDLPVFVFHGSLFRNEQWFLSSAIYLILFCLLVSINCLPTKAQHINMEGFIAQFHSIGFFPCPIQDHKNPDIWLFCRIKPFCLLCCSEFFRIEQHSSHLPLSFAFFWQERFPPTHLDHFLNMLFILAYHL